MEWSRSVTTVVLFLTVFGAVGAVVSIVTTNPLLDTEWLLPSLVTLLVCIAVAVLVALAGGPPSEWRRTPYW